MTAALTIPRPRPLLIAAKRHEEAQDRHRRRHLRRIADKRVGK